MTSPTTGTSDYGIHGKYSLGGLKALLLTYCSLHKRGTLNNLYDYFEFIPVGLIKLAAEALVEEKHITLTTARWTYAP